MEELLKLLGFTTPFMYAAAAYGLFHWLDENASDEAKAALARTMSLKDYKREQVASALVEVFDRIYTYPLLRWRTFGRSLLFTTVISVIWVFEFMPYFLAKVCAAVAAVPSLREEMTEVCNTGAFDFWPILIGTTPLLVFNVPSDYLSLFVIRPLLIRSGTKPVISLILGAVSGAAIVLAVNSLRSFLNGLVLAAVDKTAPSPYDFIMPVSPFSLLFAWPAMAVFIWLPLFALGIVAARLLTPLSWIVGRTQWFLKEGKEHPLRAIGYVAAVVVFLGTVAGRVIFSA